MQAYEMLEVELSRWCGVPHVVACASGSAALHLALESLQLPPLSEVIVPTFTMISCARAVVLAGLTPVFVDCRPNLLMDEDAFHAAKDRKTSAVMAVHIYGRVVNMQQIHYLSEPRGLAVVEDLAEAHGVRPHPDTDAAVWSFYKNKVITSSEEGGAVAFRDPNHAALARQLRDVGFTAAHDYTHVPRGHNYRLANLLAAPIRDSLRDVERNLARRRRVEQWYDAACPDEWRMPKRESCWVWDLRLPGIAADQQTAVVRALQAEGIEARHGFRPMHTQEEFRACRVVGGEVAERMSREILYLPANPDAVNLGTVETAFRVLRREVGK